MSGSRLKKAAVISLLLGLTTLAVIITTLLKEGKHVPSDERSAAENSSARFQSFGKFTLWWDEVPKAIIQGQDVPKAVTSNISKTDYAGPAACMNCHRKQYEDWSGHSHRLMNAVADKVTVKGDFSGRKIDYLGGTITFTKTDDSYRMILDRGSVHREYAVDQTIGSRFFQYYVGKQLVGPESLNHPLYSESHVLPMGYWLGPQEWIPVVHVHGEVQDSKRHDPFRPREPFRGVFSDYADSTMDLYRSQCNFCHTTFPAGDMLVRFQNILGAHVPARLDLSLAEYTRKTRPKLWPVGLSPAEVSDEQFADILKDFRHSDAREHAVTLGISCEACHLGSKEHALGKQKKPAFFPSASELKIRADSPAHDTGRTHDNINWACGRCHTGGRPQLAAGMATWNSTEYSDAMRGSCYSRLTCVRCHNPHQTLGQGWNKSPDEDDAICLSCHQKFQPDDARVAHTRHPMSSEGARCMNCHMPRLNEGLEDVVRTHMIFSPSNKAMIEANQPNACNICHVDKSIDWTLKQLKEFYNAEYNEHKISAAYPNRTLPAAIGWLYSTNESVRLLAVDSLTRAEAKWSLPVLVNSLDDPFLLNRQFGRIALERLLKIRLLDFGYRFYMTRDERQEPLRNLREFLKIDEQPRRVNNNGE